MHIPGYMISKDQTGTHLINFRNEIRISYCSSAMASAKQKKKLIILVLICLIIPQVLIYFMTEPKRQTFEVVSRKKTRNAKVYELKVPDGKPIDFVIPNLINHKTKVEFEPLNKSMYLGKEPVKPQVKINRQINKNENSKNVIISDVLPLTVHVPNCLEKYSKYQTDSYCLPNQSNSDFFIKTHRGKYCLKEGLHTLDKNDTECKCKLKWHGQSCSMHQVVYTSEYPRDIYAYLISPYPRRIINAFPFTHEFDLLEARMHELGDVVDLYIIVESNYTAAGHPRPRHLLNKLKQGYLHEYQPKILYVELGYFPQKGYYNGWVMDALLRNHAGEGLKRVKNLRENDIFVINDADELPKRETLLFLKLHIGYPQPVGFNLVHNVYGFFWRGTDKLTHVFGACSIAMLLHFFNWEPYRLRSASYQMNTNKDALDHFKLKHRGTIREWSFGNKADEIPCGWHCSWCFPPQGIRTKLEGAHWSDLPRWGAYPSKTTLDYISNLTRHGLWFDDRTKLLESEGRLSDWYAPEYIKQNYDMFKHLLVKPGDS